MSLRVFPVAMIAAVLLVRPTEAQPPKLSEDERQAVAKYAEILRSCCLPEGAINMTPCGEDSSSPVWIAPYFGDHVALALLTASDEPQHQTEDLRLVEKWINWRVDRQESGGYWYDNTGTLSRYRSNGKVDAHDSSAALFLLVLARYQRAGGIITDRMRTSARNCLKCIQSLDDGEGLTWAKPDYRIKFLMDNVEVLGGLQAAEALFAKHNGEAAEQCETHAAKIRQRLRSYEAAREPGLFAWSLQPNGSYDGGFEKLYPHGLAQLFAVASIKPNAELMARVEAKFTPETGPAATGAERYLIAASRLGGSAEKKWRAAVLRDRSLLDPATYSYRPALAILGLCEGADWLVTRSSQER